MTSFLRLAFLVAWFVVRIVFGRVPKASDAARLDAIFGGAK